MGSGSLFTADVLVTESYPPAEPLRSGTLVSGFCAAGRTFSLTEEPGSQETGLGCPPGACEQDPQDGISPSFPAVATLQVQKAGGGHSAHVGVLLGARVWSLSRHLHAAWACGNQRGG